MTQCRGSPSSIIFWTALLEFVKKAWLESFSDNDFHLCKEYYPFRIHHFTEFPRNAWADRYFRDYPCIAPPVAAFVLFFSPAAIQKKNPGHFLTGEPLSAQLPNNRENISKIRQYVNANGRRSLLPDYF